MVGHGPFDDLVPVRGAADARRERRHLGVETIELRLASLPKRPGVHAQRLPLEQDPAVALLAEDPAAVRPAPEPVEEARPLVEGLGGPGARAPEPVREL